MTFRHVYTETLRLGQTIPNHTPTTTETATLGQMIPSQNFLLTKACMATTETASYTCIYIRLGHIPNQNFQLLPTCKAWRRRRQMIPNQSLVTTETAQYLTKQYQAKCQPTSIHFEKENIASHHLSFET
jgi:hypothetical protein